MVTRESVTFQMPEEDQARLQDLCPGTIAMSPSEELLLSRFQDVRSYGELRLLLEEQVDVERQREERCKGRAYLKFTRGHAVGMWLGFALALAALERLDGPSPWRRPAKRLSAFLQYWRAG